MALPNFGSYTGQQASLYSPQQQNQLNQLVMQLQGNQPNFQNIANKARTNLHTNTIPGIAERFTSTMGQSRNSGGLQHALGTAGSDLESNLAALESQFGQGQQNLLAQLLSNRQHENIFEQKGQGFFNAAAPAIGIGLGSAAGAYAPTAISSLGSWLSGLGSAAAPAATAATTSALAPTAGSVLGGLGVNAATTASTTAASSLAPILAGASAGFPPLLALLAALGVGYGAYNYLND
jgi:hypothetical protein